MKCNQIHGNVFAQLIHDGVTLTNHKKYQSLALQFIDPFRKNNLVVCCGFSYFKKNDDIADIFKKKFKSITGQYLIDIVSIMVVDQEAIGLSTQLDLDEI